MEATKPTRDLPVPGVALAIGAHPDDVEFRCGATLAKWASQGCVVHHLILTDGSKGTWDPGEDIPALVKARVVEQQAAATALGATGQVVMLPNVDGELGSSLTERSQVAYWIRALRPDVVLGHDPWKRYRLHPDHRHAGWLATDGIVAARDPFFFPEHEVAPHRPSALLLFESDEPDHLEDVVGFEATKIAALLEHRSQFVTTMYITDENAGEELQMFRDRVFDEMRANGLAADIEFAESFKLVTDL
jgi:LmbE family N-acetylglucosaminyl deacetylase